MISIILRLLAFYLKFSRPLVVFAVLVGLLAGSTSVVLIGLINSRISNPDLAAEEFIWIFVGLAFAQFVLTIIPGILATQLAERTGFDLRLRLCRQILRTPLRQLEETGNHKILATLTQDIQNITMACIQVPQVCVSIGVLIGCFVYLGQLSTTMLTVLVVLVAVAVISIKLLEARAQVFMKRARENFDALVKIFTSLAEGMKELKLHRRRREAFFSSTLATNVGQLRQNNTKAFTTYAFVSGWGMVLYFIVVGLLIFILPDFDSRIGRDELTGYAITVLFMRSYVIGLMVLLPYFAQAGVSLRKLEDLGFALSQFRGDIDHEVEEAEPAPFKLLELKSVTHSYYRDREDSDFVLGPIDLTLRSGEAIWIVGGNGSGKTTLAKLLTGLYVPASGEIRINDELVTDDNRDQYRQNFSALFTDFHLFENLLGLNENGDGELDASARAFLNQLHLDHKVSVKDGQLSTLELSHGQRKRLALLTAFLEDRPIYVFDEWDSGQDPVFKKVFFLEVLPELKARGKTIVVISHEDRYYQLADRIVQLEFGKIEDEASFVHEVSLTGLR
jgi:putative pyoverdin transport system ATP-binding/permease protein